MGDWISSDVLSVVLPGLLLVFGLLLGALGAGHLFRLIWMICLFVFLGVLYWFATDGGLAVGEDARPVALVRLAAIYAGALFGSIVAYLLARAVFSKG